MFSNWVGFSPVNSFSIKLTVLGNGWIKILKSRKKVGVDMT